MVEELGKTEPDRAFEIYVQWYRRQHDMNQTGLVGDHGFADRVFPL